MKKTFTLFILLFFCFHAFSQREAEFLKNKLYIVQTEYPSFNNALKDVMTRLWNISEIGGYITRKQLKKMTKLKENSFLNPTTYSWDNNSQSNSGRHASGLFFYQGKKKDGYLGDPVNSIFIGGSYTGENFDDCNYRLELMITTVMNELIYARSMDSINKIYSLSLLKKKKTLLINTKYFNEKKKLEIITKGAFDNYPYKIAFASSDSITSYIKAKDKNYVLAVPVVNDITRMVLLN